MPISRVYQHQPLALGAITLTESAAHHIFRVLRAKVGDELIVFNGEGGEYAAVISQISKKSVDVELRAFIERDVESPVKLILAQGISRGEKMDFVMQKAVELGVSEIYPVRTERCNVKLTAERAAKRLAHWRGIIISACEQSGRTRLPILHDPLPYADLLSACQADKKYVLNPFAKEKLAPDSNQPVGSVAALIGPEGGLTENEVAMASKQGWSALTIGPRILRTETAAISALTILQWRFGDFA